MSSEPKNYFTLVESAESFDHEVVEMCKEIQNSEVNNCPIEHLQLILQDGKKVRPRQDDNEEPWEKATTPGQKK